MAVRAFKIAVLSLAFSLALSGAAYAKAHKERVYQGLWCASVNGAREVVLSDRARVDCVTRTHAVEVDFAPKWAEAIGQSLYYSRMTGLKPGILLILEKNGDERFLERVRVLTGELGIDVWTITPSDIKGKAR